MGSASTSLVSSCQHITGSLYLSCDDMSVCAACMWILSALINGHDVRPALSALIYPARHKACVAYQPLSPAGGCLHPDDLKVMMIFMHSLAVVNLALSTQLVTTA